MLTERLFEAETFHDITMDSKQHIAFVLNITSSAITLSKLNSSFGHHIGKWQAHHQLKRQTIETKVHPLHTNSAFSLAILFTLARERGCNDAQHRESSRFGIPECSGRQLCERESKTRVERMSRHTGALLPTDEEHIPN